MPINEAKAAKIAGVMLDNKKSLDNCKDLYKDFQTLTQLELLYLIEVIMNHTKNIRALNALIKVRDTAKVVIDHYLLFSMLKSALCIGR